MNHERIASLTIRRDHNPMNPREWDNLGVMACWHKRGHYGDVREKRFKDTPAEEWLEPWGWPRELDLVDWVASLPKGSIVVPIYMLDHSGVTLSTSSGSFRACDPVGWDWGQLGVMVATPKDIRRCYMVKQITKAIRKRAEDVLHAELTEYSCFLEGECWGYEITDDDGEEESCWGFLGRTLEETGIASSIPDSAQSLLKDAWEARS